MPEWIKACKSEQVKDGQLFSFIHNEKKILI